MGFDTVFCNTARVLLAVAKVFCVITIMCSMCLLQSC